MSSEEKEKKTDDGKGGAIMGVLGLLVVVGVVATILVGPHVYGATPMQLMDEPLARSPKQFAHDLPLTSQRGSTVVVSFRKGAAGEYEKAEVEWGTGNSDAPQSMRIRAERGAKIGDDIATVLKRRLRTFRDGRYRWGPVTIRARDDGDVSWEVDRQVGGKPNPLFDRQSEAARQLVLNAAFEIPLRLSDREIADALGTGYSPAALAKFDLGTTVENAAAAVRAAFPAMQPSGSSSFYVPLDHPLVEKVQLSWQNRAGGRMSSFSLSTSPSYAGSRAALESCLEKKLGVPVTDVTDYAAGRKEYAFEVGKIRLRLRDTSLSVSAESPVDAASFAALFQTLDGCRDAAESGGATK